MAAFLKPGVHGVAIVDDLALIDLDADAYLCLPGGARAIRDGGSGELHRDEEGFAAIVAAGLTTGQPGRNSKPAPALPRRTIIHEPPPSVGVRDVLRALGAAGEVKRAFRGTGLRPLLAVAGHEGRRNEPSDVEAAARTLWRISPWLPVEGECLLRSALLMSFLKRSDLSADWVFGVRLWPFSAHCWVQAGDVCLNDDVERLAAYTPIYCR